MLLSRSLTRHLDSVKTVWLQQVELEGGNSWVKAMRDGRIGRHERAGEKRGAVGGGGEGSYREVGRVGRIQEKRGTLSFYLYTCHWSRRGRD